MDTDGTGKVSREGFVQWYAKSEQRIKAQTRTVFNKVPPPKSKEPDSNWTVSRCARFFLSLEVHKLYLSVCSFLLRWCTLVRRRPIGGHRRGRNQEAARSFGQRPLGKGPG